MSTITPPANYDHASPQIVVSIYPQSGGQFIFSGGAGGILQAQIDKNIRNPGGGKFSLLIAPGGPAGVNDPTSWINIINPNSLVVISLSRGGSQRTVMVGLATDISESQVWTTKNVQRNTRISGIDFTYYFNTFSLYTLSFLGLLGTILPQGVAGYLLGKWSAVYQGTPALVANNYLKFIMLGQGDPSKPGVLDQTYVFFEHKQVFLRQLFSYWFETFSGTYVPFQADLLNSEGSWLDKFTSFLPFPFYEFFVITAESTDYPSVSAAPSGDYSNVAETNISVNGYPTVSPTVIGRINPLPWIEYPATPVTSTSNAVISPGSNASGSIPATTPILHNYDTWNNLTTFSLGNFSFMGSQVKYDTDEVCNFLAIQLEDTSCIAKSLGSDPNVTAMELLGAVIDRFSVNTYGYRAQFRDLRWLTWASPTALPSGGSLNYQQISNLLLGMLASWYIPGAAMLSGAVTIPMWPDVMPGNRFEYSPFKVDKTPYLFYIEGVTHTYAFGNPCTTTLTVKRGLKTTEYADPILLTDILQDAVIRQDGTFVPRSDIGKNPPAFHITPAEVAAAGGIGLFPWGGPAGAVEPSTHSYPPGTPTKYDQNFIAAAGNTTCGAGQSALTPEILKAIASTENGPFDPNATNTSPSTPGVTYVGLMQVGTNNVNPATGSNYTVAELQDPTTNIKAGAQVFCEKLQQSRGYTAPALVLYSGNTSDPIAANRYVTKVLGILNNSPKLH